MLDATTKFAYGDTVTLSHDASRVTMAINSPEPIAAELTGTPVSSRGARSIPSPRPAERSNAAGPRWYDHGVSRLVLKALLVGAGVMMAAASRWSARFRAALSRDRTIALETGDGVRHRFVVRGRAISSDGGATPRPDCRIVIATAAQALGIFLSPRGVGKLVAGIVDGTVSVEGSLYLLLWFDARLQSVLPIREPIRKPDRFPGAYLQPRDDFTVARWITREPAKSALDADWTEAWIQRRKLLMMRVAAGEPAPAF